MTLANEDQGLAIVRQRIEGLTVLPSNDRESIRDGIKHLQKALLENPSACSLLLPEDIGEMVSVIKTYVGKEVVDQKARKATSKKAPKMDASEIANVLAGDL